MSIMRVASGECKRLVLWPLIAAIALAIAFYFWPALDMKSAAQFYTHTPDLSVRFASGEKGAWKFLYEIVPYITYSTVLAVLALYLLGRWKKRIYAGVDGRALCFLLLALALGPGLVVHSLFKEQWGRPRPHHIEAFGGTKPFVPAWVMSDACTTNCSFVSGHAATGFSILSVAFIAMRRRKTIFLAGIGMGLATGLARMAQGGHFLSDILFAGFLVYFVSLAVYAALYRQWPFRASSSDL